MENLLILLKLWLCCFAPKISAYIVRDPNQGPKDRRLLTVASESFSNNFDFSSTLGWDKFYEKEKDVVEWHSSIALSSILKYIPKGSDCLVVGCGNSELPRVIHDDADKSKKGHVTCLDTSSACLDQLRKQHAEEICKGAQLYA